MPDFPDASVFQIITLYVSIFIQKSMVILRYIALLF